MFTHCLTHTWVWPFSPPILEYGHLGQRKLLYFLFLVKTGSEVFNALWHYEAWRIPVEVADFFVLNGQQSSRSRLGLTSAQLWLVRWVWAKSWVCFPMDLPPPPPPAWLLDKSHLFESLKIQSERLILSLHFWYCFTEPGMWMDGSLWSRWHSASSFPCVFLRIWVRIKLPSLACFWFLCFACCVQGVSPHGGCWVGMWFVPTPCAQNKLSLVHHIIKKLRLQFRTVLTTAVWLNPRQNNVFIELFYFWTLITAEMMSANWGSVNKIDWLKKCHHSLIASLSFQEQYLLKSSKNLSSSSNPVAMLASLRFLTLQAPRLSFCPWPYTPNLCRNVVACCQVFGQPFFLKNQTFKIPFPGWLSSFHAAAFLHSMKVPVLTVGLRTWWECSSDLVLCKGRCPQQSHVRRVQGRDPWSLSSGTLAMKSSVE